jgi:hypothetical protein
MPSLREASRFEKCASHLIHPTVACAPSRSHRRRVSLQGGVFILEPQPWKSYQQAFNKQDMPAELKHVLPTLELRPDQFAHILLTEVGFAHVEPLGTPVGVAGGFGRPLLLCRKALG